MKRPSTTEHSNCVDVFAIVDKDRKLVGWVAAATTRHNVTHAWLYVINQHGSVELVHYGKAGGYGYNKLDAALKHAVLPYNGQNVTFQDNWQRAVNQAGLYVMQCLP